MKLAITIPENKSPPISVTSECTFEQALKSATQKVTSLTQNSIFTCDGFTIDVNAKKGIFADLRNRVTELTTQIDLAKATYFPGNDSLENAYLAAIEGNNIIARIIEKDTMAKLKANADAKWKKMEKKGSKAG